MKLIRIQFLKPRTPSPESMRVTGLGDIVAKVATPIARALDLPCIDKETNKLRPESGCAKRQQALNEKFPIK